MTETQYAASWIALGVIASVLEIHAFRYRRNGTLSNNLQRLLLRNSFTRWATLAGWGAFSAWFGYHIWIDA